MFNWLRKVLPAPENGARTDAPRKPDGGSLAEADMPNSYAAHKKRGNELLAQGRLEEAAECYRKAVSVNPGYAEGFLNLGFVFSELKFYEDAERYLEQAVQINPALADAYYILGNIAQARGNLGVAIAHFEKTLDLRPGFEIVYSDLYLMLLQSGQFEKARKVIQQGLSLFPQSAQFHCYLGNLYVDESKFEQAIKCYRNALLIQPDNVEVQVRLGNALTELGYPDEALACYRKALALRPDSPAICNNLANLLRDQGNLDEAEACYQQALALNPDDAGVHSNLGTVFLDRAKLDKAQACYRRALALDPNCTDALNNLGIVFREQGNLNEAVDCYHKALSIRQDSSEIYNNFGNVLRDLGNLQEALDCYSKALELKRDDPDVLNNLGVVSQERFCLDEAVDYFSRALTLKPDFSTAHNNLGFVFQDQGNLDKALACFRQAVTLMPEFHAAKTNMLYVMQQICEWKELGTLSEQVRRGVREITSPTIENQIAPFSFLAVSGSTPAEQLRCATNWAQGKFQSWIAQEMGFEFKREPKPKLHIGYLSADFRNHPVAQLMAEVFELHDRGHFQITAYSFGPDDGGALRKRLEKAFDRFVDISDFTHDNAAKKIYEDHVDILVDLMGYTKHFRSAILALHPAPLQVNYLGYAGSMGASFIDYLIADRFVIPPDQREHYAEKMAWLPDCFMPRDSSCRRFAAPSRKDCGLPDEAFVFCSFNPSYKINPSIFDIWCDLLRAVPGSVLWLSASNPIAQSNLVREAESRGVTADRIIWAPRENLVEDHLARVQCADLFLDTSPYNAHTTCSDALWMGLPVVTCVGETFPSRVAGSLLTALGVPELITYNLESYHALALELATDKSKYANIRSKVIANRESAPLFDSRKFTRDLENLYRQMWNDHMNPPHADQYR